MGSKKTTTNEKKDPWAPAQPALNSALAGAQNAFDTTYQGTGVAEMDSLVTQGQNMAISNAQTGQLGNIGQGAVTNLTGVMNNGGLSTLQSDAATGIGNGLSAFQGQMGQAQSYLNPYASGQYLNQPNPYMEKAVGAAMQKASEAANRQFSASGRYGSGAHSGVLGDTLGNIANTAYMNDYNQQQQNQLSAIGQMGNFASAGLQGTMGAQNAMAGIGQQGISNTGAIAGAIPQLGDAMNADAANLAKVGAQRMDYNQTLIDAANQNPWKNVNNLANVASTIGSLGGTATKTSKESGGVGGVIGGALGGLGALGNLGKGIGGFKSLLALSDIRAKENIEYVGETDRGHTIIDYNYKGHPDRVRGLIAQDVAMTQPDAVAQDPGTGLLMVDYRRALSPKNRKVA